jgi:uncharacterized protein YggE
VREGFYAATTINFTSDDLDAYRGLWLGLSAMDGVTVNAAQYAIADREPIEDDVRRKALLDARDKAADLAKTLDVTLGEPLRIIEGGGGYYAPAPEMGRMLKADAAGGPVQAPGRITVRVNIQAVFRLINVGH